MAENCSPFRLKSPAAWPAHSFLPFVSLSPHFPYPQALRCFLYFFAGSLQRALSGAWLASLSSFSSSFLPLPLSANGALVGRADRALVGLLPDSAELYLSPVLQTKKFNPSKSLWLKSPIFLCSGKWIFSKSQPELDKMHYCGLNVSFCLQKFLCWSSNPGYLRV